ncbi:hypothetical protein [Rubellimicrobium sp. CFH 75288]|uniref:hypothetical protein n=1 Tax=Rubellimicrobium sp. CFH 75288 TaxID=2697034 RepID=UPI0014137802|nr:hypothetical protein [Rubellimicrobium sp. CFH 75288]
MTARLIGLLALLTLAGFLGILIWKLRRLDLGVLVGITLALALWDFVGRRR